MMPRRIEGQLDRLNALMERISRILEAEEKGRKTPRKGGKRIDDNSGQIKIDG